MPTFNILLKLVQSFKIIVWKPREELIIQTCYTIQNLNLKIV